MKKKKKKSIYFIFQKFYKKSALYLLRTIAKHSDELADFVINEGGLHVIINCLDDFDYGVKEAAVWAIGYIAKHNRILSQTIVDAGNFIIIN